MYRRQSIAYLIGGAISLLAARLALRLLAARPDNLFVQTLLDGTAPLVAPLSFLDTGQPRFGATLELSTLALIAMLAVLILGLWISCRRARYSDPT